MSGSFILYTDGAAKGNPGPAGIGVAIFGADDDSEPRETIAEYIGETTNNVAEYKALIRGLTEALRLGADNVEVRTDSELMARQIAGRYKVSAPQIAPLYTEAAALLGQFGTGSVVRIPREKNSLADKLANRGISERSVPPASSAPRSRDLDDIRASNKSRPAASTAARQPTVDRARHKHTRTVGGERWVWYVDRLLIAARGMQREMVPLSHFDYVLDGNFWFEQVEPTIRLVARHARRIYDADLSHPVILSQNGELMDGGHRIARAHLLGVDRIAVVRFSTDPPPDLRLPLDG